MRLRKDWKAFIIFGTSMLLWIVSLWQLEIIWIWLRKGKDVWEFPFFVWQTSTWSARDLCYILNGIAILIPLIYILYEGDDARSGLDKRRSGEEFF